MDQFLIQQTIVTAALKYEGLKESNGKNRSPAIDKIILAQGGSLGEPYCMYGCQQVIDDVEKMLGIKFDVPEGGGTQRVFTMTKPHFITKAPVYGSIGIMQKKLDPTKGHAFIVIGPVDDKGNFPTFEFNTNPGGSRDGDGCYRSTRNIKGSLTMRMRGYINLAKAAQTNISLA